MIWASVIDAPRRTAAANAIEEVESGDWGIGGRGLTTQDVKDLQGQPAAALH